MAVFTLSEAAARALGGLVPAPSPAPNSPAGQRRMTRVLTGSVEAGVHEKLFFSVPAKGETDHLLRTARRTLDAARRLRRDARAGDRILTAVERGIAALTGSAVRVFEEILTLARLNRGQVFPTYDYLAAATGLGRATIARALPVLEAIGFIQRQRRFRRVAVAGIGTRYAQTSNMYRALLPAKVLSYLPRWMRPAPIPADDIRRRSDDAASRDAMLATLTCRELALTTTQGALSGMLAKLGAAIDRSCESQHDAERLTDSNDQPPATRQRPTHG